MCEETFINMILRIRTKKKHDKKCEEHVRRVLSEAYEKLEKGELVNE